MIDKRRFEHRIWKPVVVTILLGSATVFGQVPTGPCLDPTVPLAVEEAQNLICVFGNNDP